MSFEWLALLMFGAFFVILLLGYPVAFSFAGTAFIFGTLGLALGAFNLDLLRLLPNRWFGTMSDITLLAVPFFIYLGTVLERSGIAEELLETVGMLFGPLRGGIALAVVVVGTLLAATTGVVAATVIAMGLISLPVMLRYGYNKELATGVIAASGTMAQLIPPSLVLVVVSDQIGVSVGDLFAGALIPGLIMAGSFAAYCLVLAWLNPRMAPALPLAARNIGGAALAAKTARAVLPPMLLILAVLGSIFFGLATPTEAGSVGAVGAMLLAAANRRFSWKLVTEAAESTVRTTALVIMILFCSTIFSLVFDGLGGTQFMRGILTNLPGGYLGFLIVCNIVVFLLGIFLEFIEITFIIMPVLTPAALALGIDLTWFGVLMAINLQTAFISPPVGFSLFYLQSVVPKEVRTIEIHRGAIPFMLIQLAVLIVVIAFPDTVLWLVRASAGN
jgi:tripartite ATP-independent transporter DctM subunit